ncbi:MAG: PAS domain S-box protein [Pirellulales bacterium]|nr:PAS domain S-box protein [Pirellulales bacterium]
MANVDSPKQGLPSQSFPSEKLPDSRAGSICLDEKAADPTKREWFLQAFDASPVAVSISTLSEGRFIEVNRSFLEMTGYTRDEIIGKTAKEIGFWYRPDDRHELIQMLHKTSGPLRHADFPIRTKMGEPCLAGLSVNLIDLEGLPCLLIVYRELAKDAKDSGNDLTAYLNWEVRRLRDQLEHCVAELTRIGDTISCPAHDVPVKTIGSSLGTLVPTLVTSLRSLQSIRESLNSDEQHDDLFHLILGLQRNTMLEAIEDAVKVIEKTKKKFKSKDLAELRLRLCSVLQKKDEIQPCSSDF